jgi:hypothetical protein
MRRRILREVVPALIGLAGAAALVWIGSVRALGG